MYGVTQGSCEGHMGVIWRSHRVTEGSQRAEQGLGGGIKLVHTAGTVQAWWAVKTNKLVHTPGTVQEWWAVKTN